MSSRGVRSSASHIGASSEICFGVRLLFLGLIASSHNVSVSAIFVAWPEWLEGARTSLLFSSKAWRIACFIRHTAYEISLNPFVSSKRLAAFIKPIFPSLIKSPRGNHWYWYCLATEITKRRFAFVSSSSAILSFSSLMSLANSASCSGVSRPIKINTVALRQQDWHSKKYWLSKLFDY